MRGSQRAAVDLLIADRSIKTVVLTSLGPYYFSGQSFAADHHGRFDASRVVLQPVAPDPGISKTVVFERGLSDTISRLEGSGKHVVLFIDVPELDFQPQSCIDNRPVHLPGAHVRTPCGVERSRVMSRQAVYRQLIARLERAHPTLRTFDPIPYLCDARLCYALQGDRFLYRDSNHLSVFGSEYLAKHFDEWLRSAGRQ